MIAARIDPFAPHFMADPYPAYRELLASGRPQRLPFGFWGVTSFEHVNGVLRDPRFGHDFAGGLLARQGPAAFEEPAARAMRHWILVLNPPDHTRIRELFAGAFSPRNLLARRGRIEALVHGLVERVAARGAMDLMTSVAFPLPALVVCELLGIPAEEREPFVGGTRIPVRLIDVAPLSREQRAQANDDVAFLSAYFEDLCERRRREPQDDLTTALVQAECSLGRLSSAELTANLVLLFGAAQETTANFIGNAVLALDSHPAERARLQADPGLWPNAIEELLRYDSSVQVALRTALEDVELGGVRIARGERVLAFLGAANHDPAVYREPERLDLGRRGVRVMSFGGGIHHCLGAQLARIESQAALQALYGRLPGLRVDRSRPLRYRPTLTVRGVAELPLVWDARAAGA